MQEGEVNLALTGLTLRK